LIGKRAWINYALDMLLLLAGLVLAVSSMMLWVILEKGYSPSWLTWIEIHKWSGFGLFVAAVTHVGLHWKWLLAMSRRVFRRSLD